LPKPKISVSLHGRKWRQRHDWIYHTWHIGYKTRGHDGKDMSVGNGSMVALQAKDEAQVNRVYDLALSLGGTCEGPPGLRGGGFYAAYFRDLDGHKLNAFCMGAPEG